VHHHARGHYLLNGRKLWATQLEMTGSVG